MDIRSAEEIPCWYWYWYWCWYSLLGARIESCPPEPLVPVLVPVPSLRHILCTARLSPLREVSQMENDFSSVDSTVGQSSAAPTSNAASENTASTNNNTNTGTNTDQRFSDRARDLAGSAQGKIADIGSTVRDRAGHMKDSLADALETGADKLRQRGTQSTNDQGGNLAGATNAGSVAVGDGRGGQVTDRVASGMDKTAGWLRDADLDGMRTTIETQVKEHPGRTLLIAAGLGYLLGKALRK
jgi:hypothetical protein